MDWNVFQGYKLNNIAFVEDARHLLGTNTDN